MNEGVQYNDTSQMQLDASLTQLFTWRNPQGIEMPTIMELRFVKSNATLKQLVLIAM